MIEFLKHKKFWLPLILVLFLILSLEVLLRFNVWDRMIAPHSFLGNAVYRKQAIEDFGLENIHWITVGDSKSDWGLEHKAILDIQKINGDNHLRMSFESSNFMAIQATIDWSIANMPNLKGVLLGVSEDAISHLSDVTTQYNVAWPFRDFFDYQKYHYFASNYQSYAYLTSTALHVYYKDFKNFIKHLPRRFKMIERYQGKAHKNIFNYNRNLSKNICHFSLKTIQQCVQTAENLNKKHAKLRGIEQFVVANCGNENSKIRARDDLPNYYVSNANMHYIIDNWKGLFDNILAHDLNLKVMILPESVMYNYVIRPENARQILLTILDDYILHERFEILDSRKLFQQQSNAQQCEYYNDPIHFNNKGKTLLTQKVVASFASTAKRSDEITIINFENH